MRENVSLKAQNAQQRKRGEGVENLEKDCDEYRRLAQDLGEEASWETANLTLTPTLTLTVTVTLTLSPTLSPTLIAGKGTGRPL